MPFKKKDNRRKYQRVSLYRLVKITLLNTSQPIALTHLSDLSESGFRFQVSDLSDVGSKVNLREQSSFSPANQIFSKIKRGDQFSFKVHLDPARPEIHVAGRVAWVERQIASSGQVRMIAGIEFVNLSPSDCKLIQVYVATFKD